MYTLHAYTVNYGPQMSHLIDSLASQTGKIRNFYNILEQKLGQLVVLTDILPPTETTGTSFRIPFPRYPVVRISKYSTNPI